MNMNNRKYVDFIINGLGIIEHNSGDSFKSSLRRIATWGNSFVNYAFQDLESKKTVAILFRNDCESNDNLKEKTIRALNSFDSVIDAFDAGSLMDASQYADLIEKEGLFPLAIGVVVYDNNGNISTMKQLMIPHNVAVKRTEKEQKSYWCWWRDASQYEVALLLKLSKKYDLVGGDIYTDKVYPEFFQLMIEGKTKKWDGTPRKKTFSKASFKSEKQNYKIPMCQLGLWTVETGHITGKGKKLLNVVETYGEGSSEYFDCLAKMILLDGKHLDLVKDLEDFQQSEAEIIPKTSAEFFILFDNYMMEKNSIGTRKPSAIKTGAKKSYVRDEPKLWNKLGIIKMQSPSRYYRPFVGIKFNWERINKVLLSNVLGEDNEKI